MPCRSTSCSALQEASSADGHRDDLVDGDGEADALRAGADGHVDADHLAVDVQQRPARVAGIDAGVGLDQVVVELGVAHLDRAVQRADDAAGDRVLVAVGVADRDDRLARHQVGGGAERHHRQRRAGVDLDDGQIGFHVAGHQLGDVPLAVGQGDEDFADAVDHVIIGDDVAAGVDHHAGAHAVDAAAGVGAGGLSGAARRRSSRRGC